MNENFEDFEDEDTKLSTCFWLSVLITIILSIPVAYLLLHFCLKIFPK